MSRTTATIKSRRHASPLDAMRYALLGVVLLLHTTTSVHAWMSHAARSTCHTFRTVQQVLPLHMTNNNNDDDDLSNDASHNSNNNSNNQDDILVTKEMFLRDLLQDPVVKRSKGKKGQHREYRVLDNRDSLPFAVEITTPDPYTHPEIKRRTAAKHKRTPGAVEHTMASTLYVDSSNDNNDEPYKTKLGEFLLDKHTTTGDVLEVGNVQYKVVRHKCQYKYAGGKRFVMVRKILQVKEIGRLQTEEYLARQLSKSPVE
jgi:hypothetical protein